MRFIIYKEEFANGRRTAELRDCLFASESERVARRKQRELFAGEVYRYRQTYWSEVPGSYFTGDVSSTHTSSKYWWASSVAFG